VRKSKLLTDECFHGSEFFAEGVETQKKEKRRKIGSKGIILKAFAS
jgi:hypothetical protein